MKTNSNKKHNNISKSMINRHRWLAYLDLLGVKIQIHSGQLANIVKIYDQAIDDLEKIVEPKNVHSINCMWFSDTFLIYSADDSKDSFIWLEQATRLFFDKLILSEIPVRGAISIGDLYTNKKKGIIVGDALVTAYEFGEAQNWIGLLLTPQAIAWMYENGLNPKIRLNYAKMSDVEVLKSASTTELYAYRMIKPKSTNDKQEIIEKIIKLKNMSPEGVWPKYDSTLKFIKKNQLRRQ